jgi:hypothetical protein
MPHIPGSAELTVAVSQLQAHVIAELLLRAVNTPESPGLIGWTPLMVVVAVPGDPQFFLPATGHSFPFIDFSIPALWYGASAIQRGEPFCRDEAPSPHDTTEHNN